MTKDRKLPSTNQQQSSNVISVELQQLVLNVFRDAYTTCINESLASRIQEVKQHLFNRDFTQAFGNRTYLEAYVLRWSCGRSLMYLDVFSRLSCLLNPSTINFQHSQDAVRLARRTSDQNYARIPLLKDSKPDIGDYHPKSSRVVCLGGGGGAELIGLAAYMRHLNDLENAFHHECKGSKSFTETKVTIVDIADWSEVLHKLYHGATTPPVLSKFVNSKSKASAGALVDAARFSMEFVRQDILQTEVEHLSTMLQDVDLLTIFFTLNELYSTSMSDTTNLLLSMTYLLAPGTLLLIIDSPGSYSTVNVGKTSTSGEGVAEKNYPMQWLLDHTLLEASAIGSSKSAAQEKQWEKVETCDSRWCRLRKELRYPIELEDMRYQMHLYRRL